MKRLYSIILFVLLIFVPSVHVAGAAHDGSSWWNTDYNTTEGTDFWVTYMFNYGNTEHDSQNLSLRLFATCRQNCIVTIYYNDNTTETFNINAFNRSIHNIDLSKAYVLREREVLSKGVHITASKPISLYAVSQNSIAGSQDATNLYPTKMLTGDYIIQTYGSDGVSTEFAVLATAQTSGIDIVVRKTDIRTPDTYVEEIINTGYMQKGDVYLYRSNDAYISLSGTKICSNVPIAVFHGGQHADIPFGTPNKNHIYSQAAPIDMWGRTFIATNSWNQEFDYVRITSYLGNTKIYKNDEGSFYNMGVSLSSGDTYQDTINSIDASPKAVVYKTTKPAEAYIYLTDYNLNNISHLGAPAMSMLNPMELGTKTMLFTTLDAANIQKHYVNVVTYSATKGGMRLTSNNGAEQDISSQFIDIEGTEYAFAEIEIAQGVHFLKNIRTESPLGVFIAHVYGLGQLGLYGRRESYAYSGGSRTNRSVDLLIEDRYRKTLDTCINEDPVKFSAVINFEYDSIGWQSKLIGTSTKSGHKDSIFTYDYDEPGTDTLRLIVKSHTELCNRVYHYDTIWALINVHDTAHYDMRYGDTTFMTVCYGDNFSVRYKEGENLSVNHTFKADTTTTQNFLGKDQKFKLNTLYLVKDSFKTSWGCDSVVWQRFIIRPTYQRTIYDTICVSDLPYHWKDKDDNLIRNLDLSPAEKAALTITDKNAYITKKKTDSYNPKSIYGCDSITNIELTVLPIYKLTQNETVCVDSINPYIWEGHSMAHVYNSDGEKVSSISLRQSGDYTYIDSLKTHGCKACELAENCDSIWILHLKVLDRHVKDTKSSMCSNESYLWEDTLWIGWNAELPATEKYKRVFSTDTVLYHAYKTKDIYECDSVIIHRLHICDAYMVVKDTTRIHICEDESYFFESKNKTYKWSTSDGVVSRFVLTDTIKTIDPCYGNHRCDSAIAHVVYVHPEYYKEDHASACQQIGGKYIWAEHMSNPKGLYDKKNGTYVNEIPLDEAGDFEYIDSIKTETCEKCKDKGCDSVWVLKLHVNPLADKIEPRTLCENDTLHWRGKVYVGGKASATKKAGIPEGKWYWADPKPYSGMPEDEYRTPKTYQTIEHLWNGNKYTDSVHYHTINGCDSIYWLELTITPTYDIHETLTLCDNSSLKWQDTIYAGYKSGLTTGGKTRVIPSGISEIDLNHQYNTKGVYACDSTYYLHLIINKSYRVVVKDTICESALPYNYDDPQALRLQNLTESGLYKDTIPSVHGCDSIIELQLKVWETTVYEHDVLWCYSAGAYEYGEHGKTAITTGVYKDTLITKNAHGCDSVEIVHLTVLETIVDVEHDTICDDAVFNHPDVRATKLQNLNVTGIYRDTLKSISDCDSVIELHLQVWETYEVIHRDTICDNGELEYEGTIYKDLAAKDEPYAYDVPLHSIHGCDSLVHFYLKVWPTYHDAIKYDTICESALPYNYDDPRALRLQNLTETGLYKDTIPSVHGCDSIIELQLKVWETTFHEHDVLWCYSAGAYEYGEHGKTAITTGVYKDTLITKNAHGCDSVEIVHLTVLETIVDVEHDTICDDAVFNHPDVRATKLQNLNVTGIYRDTLKSISDCDSVIELHLQVWETYEVIHRDTICDNGELEYEGTIYKDLAAKDEPYAYDVPLHSIHGCDSLVHFYLKVWPTYHDAIKYDTICESALPYNYDDPRALRLQNLTETGLYKDTIPSVHGCDSIIELQLKVWETTFHEHDVLWCYSAGAYEYGEHGKTAITTGVYKDTLITKNAHGCDSVEIVHLTVLETIVDVEHDTICDDAVFNHPDVRATKLQNLNVTGIYRDTLKSISDCDSVIELHLQVWETYEVIHRDTICDNGELEYEGTIYKDLAAKDEPYAYDVPLHSVHGCDSLVHFYLKVWPTYSYSQDTIVCQDRNNNNWEWTDEFGGIHVLESPISIANVGAQHLVDNLSSQYGCDSIFEINIVVVPSYYFFDTLTICEDDTIHWQDSAIAGNKYSGDYALELRDTKPHGVYDYSINYGTKIYGCDSIYNLHLIIHPAYLTVEATDTTIVHICDNESYHFKMANEDDVYNANGEWARSDKAVESHLLTGTDTTAYGCDSVVAHIVYIHPTYDSITYDTACLVKDGTFEWIGHMNNPRGLYDVNNRKWVTEIPIGVADDYTYIDSLKTTTCTDCRNGKGCDSIWTLHLSVRQTYYYYDTLAICENDTVHWQDSVIAGSKYSGDYALELRDTKPHGVYDYSINYGTKIYGCDSIYNLHLIIHPAYLTVDAIDTTIVHICDNETYRFKTAQVDTTYNSTIRDWVTGDKSIGRHVLTGWDTTRYGCDSAVAHVVYVHPTYEYRQEFTVCQDTINTAWEWVDEFGNPHEVPISLYHPGDYIYADTLKTTTCTDCRNGEGCDSVFYVNIHIPPIYRFDSSYVICENERMTWQGRSYAGDSAQINAGDRVLSVGLHYDTAYYKTWEGCDSIYYMQVQVHAVYDTTTYVTICGQEDYVWQQHDLYGTYNDAIWLHQNIDTVYLTAEEALLPQPAKKDTTLYAERMLKTIHECDSMSRLWLTVKPAYIFITDTTICTTDRVTWRGKRYAAKDTIIIERYPTRDNGCDSIYQLHLHTKPSYLFRMPRVLCDNDTLFHMNSRYVVWAPGQEIPNPEDCYGISFTTVEGCDSLYCYYLTINPTYFFDDTIDLCTGETYVFHDTHNILFDTIYDTGQYIPAMDTIFKDTLSTIHGCDSVYWLYTTVYPTYRHIEEYSICDNDSLIWRDWTYKGITLDANGLSAGSYTYYDSLLTQYGCDSVYILKLHVNPTYFYELHEEICDDDQYVFHGRILSGSEGEYFYTDSMYSIHGCDSVYHLYLTIHPSTHEVRYDTLCAGESYDFHDKLLYDDGYYIDTTINEWGCRHVTELYLTVEDPTSVQVDFISEFCDNEKVMEIHYSYEGRMPISYSVLFDEFGHSQGFTDIIKEPVKEEGIIHINIPYGDPLPKPIYNPLFLETEIDTFRYVDTTHLDYPRPGTYKLSVFLQNGVCADDRIRVDTVFEMLFPKWIHEQHWNDAIVLFNEKYNGGYVFDDFQWYCDGELIPGEVQGYLYDPQLLKFGSEYCVKLTYTSIKGIPIIGSAFTCPITPTMMVDTIVPIKPYVAVVPTCLPEGLSGVDILCTEEGTHSYTVYTSVGLPIITGGKFKVDSEPQVHHVPIPQEPGIYVVNVITQSGYRRSVKVKRGCALK